MIERPTKGGQGDGSGELPGRISSALAIARRELIDLSRRNRLLHCPRTGKRPHCLELIGADPEALFDALTRSGKSFGFRATDSTESEFTSEAEDNRRIHGHPRLQTRLAQDVLDRRLLKFFREARVFEEEQGVNILYVAIGFLNWFEDANSEEACWAPLLLVPVSLERRQGRDPIVLRGREDDLHVNVSLREKLRIQFGLTLPDLPEGDEWLATGYLNEVATAVAGQHRWQVDSQAIGLGFFTFSKFLMWRDLDAGAWPEANRLLAHKLLAGLLGEGDTLDPGEPLATDDEPIDEKIDLASAVHVLNADSSQAVAIEEAGLGRDLVIQGPPGTGKSQTIANVIATAIARGRSVLFVAEKAAALEVVHSRLKAVGLEALCLELHSRKATKANVIASLERALRFTGGISSAGRNSDQLREARNQLNHWCRALHQEIGRSGRSPFAVMGTVLKLSEHSVRLLDAPIADISTWDVERLRRAGDVVDRAAASVAALGLIPKDHWWSLAQGDWLTPFNADRLRKALIVGHNIASALLGQSEIVQKKLGIASQSSVASISTVIDALNHLARLPLENAAILARRAWCDDLSRISAIADKGSLISRERISVDALVVPSAWSIDLAQMRHVLGAYGRSITGLFVGRYRKVIADLRGVCRDTPPKKLEDRLALLDRMIALQDARIFLEREAEFARAAFGDLWAGEETPWELARSLITWVGSAETRHRGADFLSAAAEVEIRNWASKISAGLNSLKDHAKEALQQIDSYVRLGSNDPENPESWHKIDLPSLIRLLEKWRDNVDNFNDWVAARDALTEARKFGAGQIADGLWDGGVSPREARSMFDLLVAEALWKQARSENSSLDEIEGTRRTEFVERFQQLDRQRIVLAREDVIARYMAAKPSGGAGEMGVIRGEIGKKRRHLPIRKLIEQAGHAVQRLKPVFLMSPLSVAQFLPPGRLDFDLVVIDEASQVSPEDALGVVARAKQMVVVGDDKQLPPTNFFRMVTADEDDGDAETDLKITPARTADFESILTLARARGLPERMLRWHYRSQHPSLIAVSNQTCYAGQLLLPPSPFANREELGVKFVATPPGYYDRGGTGRNPKEAEIVASAVRQHLEEHPEQSLGVACFSVAQRDAIEDALHAKGLTGAVEAFAPKSERLFVKNLETVQGDERDVIFISIGYGRDGQGRMSNSFGPISAEGGERRLNVLISRARRRCIVFSSLSSGDISATSGARGTRMLREFLHFAQTGSTGVGQTTGFEFDSAFEEAVAIAIRRNGYQVEPQVGVSGFRVDLGVLHPRQAGRFVLGIECDGAAYHSARSARDRDRLRQEILEGLGWRLHRIWSTDWFRHREREIKKLFAAIEDACRDENEPPPADSSPRIPTEDSPRDESANGANGTIERMLPFADVLSFEPYIEGRPSAPRGTSLLDLDNASLARLAVGIIEKEGPVHTEEVARRIRQAFGLERTGSRILDRISEALRYARRQGQLINRGQFWSMPGCVLTKPRSRRNASLSLKRADRIAPEEFGVAIAAVLAECVALSLDELVVSVSRALGFDRSGSDLEHAIRRQSKSMLAEGLLREEGVRLMLSSRS